MTTIPSLVEPPALMGRQDSKKETTLLMSKEGGQEYEKRRKSEAGGEDCLIRSIYDKLYFSFFHTFFPIP